MKSAWVIGGSSGIGAALVERLSAAGWSVAVSARGEEALHRLAACCQGDVLAVPLDVTRPEAVKAAFERVESGIGPVGYCFLNAATYEPMPLEAFAIDRFRRAVEVNFMGVVNGLDVVLPAFRQRRSGQVLITASVAGYRGLPKAAPYNATKAALISLAESLRPELAREGVWVRVINPGFVETPLTDKNDFVMPALIKPAEAADQIVRRLDDTGFEIAFPRRFVWAMKLLRQLPYPLFFALTRRLVGA
ncbi:MAG: SDR family NAD(P)-dependent oxidoreductase [Gammaproteobacteria bacterium]